jgi:SAM-dependent methyltransferase
LPRRPIFVDKHWSPAGVTAQFIDDAETYHRQYFDRLDFVQLIDYCLTLAGIDRQREMRVLDIGSGGGSSVLAGCRLLPHAEIFASDISPRLLAMLAAFVESRDELRGRIKTFCFDLHRRFSDRNLDVVGRRDLASPARSAGGAHPRVRQSEAGRENHSRRTLEAGSLVLTAMYGGVLRVLGELGQGDDKLARLMKVQRLDIQSRLGPPSVKRWTGRLDDKWVFDEPYLHDLARQLGLSRSTSIQRRLT